MRAGRSRGAVPRGWRAGQARQEYLRPLTAPYWLDLPADVHAARLAELGRWVSEVLAVNYPDALRCSCWASHPAAIWELSTLREEWLRVYDRTYPDLAGALAWHDHWLPGAAARINATMKDCAAGCTARPRRAAAP